MVTARFEATIAARSTRKKDPWYHSQKEHWHGWLSEYDGPGFYGRTTWNVTAEAVYNRVVIPSMVLWLGEAAGVPISAVEEAARRALAAKSSMVSQAGAIRQIIPWALIAEHL